MLIKRLTKIKKFNLARDTIQNPRMIGDGTRMQMMNLRQRCSAPFWVMPIIFEFLKSRMATPQVYELRM